MLIAVRGPPAKTALEPRPLQARPGLTGVAVIVAALPAGPDRPPTVHETVVVEL